MVDTIDRQDNIEVLSEVLGSLRITKEYILEGNITIKLAIQETKEMLTVPVLAIYNRTEQVVMLKSMVSDPEWFDGDQTKFEDWWRGI